MTTVQTVTITCAVCGTASEQQVMMSSNSFGSQDLDTRPPEMLRSTLPLWVQRCPQCGYCAPSLDQAAPGTAQVVARSDYRAALAATDLPALAAAFWCASIVAEAEQNYAGAGWQSLRAAWVCDDADDAEGARRCRKRAVEMWQAARLRGVNLGRQAGAGEAILIDAMRRSGQFTQAQSVAEEVLRGGPEETIARVLRFQLLLISQRDMGCYTVAQGLGNT